METRTEQHGNTEVGVIIHEGKEFKASGAETHVTAYLGKAGMLTKWDGTPIGTYRITRTWNTPRSFVSSTMSQVYATVNGKVYTGRSAGLGMVFNGKLAKEVR